MATALALLLALLMPGCTPSAPVKTDGPGGPAPAEIPAATPAAPAAPEEETPAGVDIRGRVTEHHRSATGEPPVGSIRVEGTLEAGTRHDKASIRITRDTKIVKGRGGQRMPFNALTVGTLVEATFTGPVAESYPVQATASEIVILEDGPPEATPSSSFEGTAGIVEKQRPDLAPALLRGVRAASQYGFDRVVFEFEGSAVPGYHVEYVDRPVIQCGSGEPVEVAGDGWLEVRLTPANAHTEEGQPTAGERERRLSLPILKELQSTCDFEAHVTWVLGVASPNRYRVLELSNPARLIVDVRH